MRCSGGLRDADAERAMSSPLPSPRPTSLSTMSQCFLSSSSPCASVDTTVTAYPCCDRHALEHGAAVGMVFDDRALVPSPARRSSAGSAGPPREASSASLHSASGSSTSNVEPASGPSLVARIRPPWSSMMLRAMLRPSRDPPCRRQARAAFERRKQPFKRLGVEPAAVSHEPSRAACRRCTSMSGPESDRCCSLNLTALFSTFQNTCWSRTSSPRT